MLDRQIEAAIAAGPIERANLVEAMEEAGIVDLRAQEDLPFLLQAMGPTAPGSCDPRAQDMRDRWPRGIRIARSRSQRRATMIRSRRGDHGRVVATLVARHVDASSANAIDNLRLELERWQPRNPPWLGIPERLYERSTRTCADPRPAGSRPVVADVLRAAECLADCRTALWTRSASAAATRDGVLVT